jgi:SAM-dependent methyltransferase
MVATVENGAASTTCCARFYEQGWVRALLGDSFHPGGVEVSARLVESLSLPPGARVLDVACGVGTTTLLMARQFGLDPVGLDASEANLTVARERTAEAPPVLVEFVRGSAAALPFPDDSFDAVVCECALSTFPDQPAAVAEARRVLKPGGVVGLSDMAVEGEFSDDLAQWAAPWACVVGARSVPGYQQLFAAAGFRCLQTDDESAALIRLTADLKRKLLLAGLSQVLGALPGLDVTGLRSLLDKARDAATAGLVRYTRFVFAHDTIATAGVG